MIDKWGEKIYNTIFSSNYVGCEIEGDLQVIISYAEIRKRKVYLFGLLSNMDCFLKFFLCEGINVEAIVDRTGENINKDLFGIPIISLSEFCKGVVIPENTILISFSELKGEEHKRFDEIIKESKIERVFYLDSTMRKIITTNSVEKCDRDRILFYRNNIDKIIDLLPYYDDEESYQVMNEYLRTYSERDIYRNKEIKTRYKYFYGEKKENLYSHLENEIWMNFGANTGDTIFAFLRNGLKAKKIYAIEANKKCYEKLVQNVKMLPDKMRKIIEAKNIFVDKDTNLDKLIGNDMLTFINADIEGAELSMLHVLGSKIKRDHPVLAICLYHKKEDLIEIPQYIRQLYKGYRFILRKYAYCWGNVNRNEELVLYAVPENRKIK